MSVDTGIPESVAPESVPEWAVRRAVELSNAASECGESGGLNERNILNLDTGHAFARYIAAHEQPPVDPLHDALRVAFCGLHWAFTDSDIEFVVSRLKMAGIELAHAGES